MTTELVLNNFTRGKMDSSLKGRFDLPFYFNGFETLKNFISNYKGNLKVRTGFMYVSKTRNNDESFLSEFRFNTEQSYLIEWAENYARFYTYDKYGNLGYVVDNNGNLIEMQTDITVEQARELVFAQNADVCYLTMNRINPKKLVRSAANSFTLSDVSAQGLNFTTLGYPSSCCFYSGRLWYGGYSKKVTTVNGSKTVEYDNFSIPSSNIKPEDPLSLTLSEITDPILWIYGGKKNLIVGNTEGISIINGGGYGQPITSTEVSADFGNREGSCEAFPDSKDGIMFYASQDKKKIYSFDYDMMSESFISSEITMLNETVLNGRVKYICRKKDNNNLIYVLMENGKMAAFLFNRDENIIGWFPLETSGFVNSICSVVRPDGVEDLFISVNRNGTNYIERMANEVIFPDFYDTELFEADKNKKYFRRIISEEIKNIIYLDNASSFKNLHEENITLQNNIVTCAEEVFSEENIGHNIEYRTKNGSQFGSMRIKEFISATQVEVEILSEAVEPLSYDWWYLSFNSISNLNDLEGRKLSVVGNGGYLGEYTVSDGKIVLDREVTTLVIGIPYQAIANTFNLGSYAEGVNLQTKKKIIKKITLRCLDSCGLKVGTSLDKMNDVQFFSIDSLYDNSPLPIDEDVEIVVDDDWDSQKRLLIMQDKPLPANIVMVEIVIDYGIN